MQPLCRSTQERAKICENVLNGKLPSIIDVSACNPGEALYGLIGLAIRRAKGVSLSIAEQVYVALYTIVCMTIARPMT